MTERYVIDENVILNAWHGKKSDNSDAVFEKKFMADIFCGNQEIMISDKIFQKIIRFSKNAEKISKGVDNVLVSLLLKLVNNSSRTKYHTPTKINFEGVKKCDVEFVGTALKSGATLITEDGKLKDAIEADSSVSNCNCKTVEEAITDHDNISNKNAN